MAKPPMVLCWCAVKRAPMDCDTCDTERMSCRAGAGAGAGGKGAGGAGAGATGGGAASVRLEQGGALVPLPGHGPAGGLAAGSVLPLQLQQVAGGAVGAVPDALHGEYFGRKMVSDALACNGILQPARHPRPQDAGGDAHPVPHGEGRHALGRA